jgi:hypothetical protein
VARAVLGVLDKAGQEAVNPDLGNARQGDVVAGLHGTLGPVRARAMKQTPRRLEWLTLQGERR